MALSQLSKTQPPAFIAMGGYPVAPILKPPVVPVVAPQRPEILFRVGIVNGVEIIFKFDLKLLPLPPVLLAGSVKPTFHIFFSLYFSLQTLQTC
jgi:hypothetical protein